MDSRQPLHDLPMGEFIGADKEKVRIMIDVKLRYLRGEITLEESRAELKRHMDRVTPEEFALVEQYLHDFGISDDEMHDKMDDVLEMFDELMDKSGLDAPPGHPIHTFRQETRAIRGLIAKCRAQAEKKFIQNEWAVLMDQLDQVNIHNARKHNQLFPMLEKVGFDRPSKVMWTFDNENRDAIKAARVALQEGREEDFLRLQAEAVNLVEEMMGREEDILFPTAMKLVSQADFVAMARSDHEIGYCLIDPPPAWPTSAAEAAPAPSGNLAQELAQLLGKYGLTGGGQSSTGDEVLDVAQGKLTLHQINLIFKHLPVDLSYVDEHDLVAFYSDTKHRVFPRSAGVIGREVRNCHPRESVATVERIIEAFRSGAQDEAEFWIQAGPKFIYILYVAVRDEDGTFRGVLEMMQDATHIRSLTGQQRILSWDDAHAAGTAQSAAASAPAAPAGEPAASAEAADQGETYGITPQSTVGALVKQRPYLKDVLLSLSPKFEKLNNPILFATMANVATLEMVSARGNIPVEQIVSALREAVKARENG